MVSFDLVISLQLDYYLIHETFPSGCADVDKEILNNKKRNFFAVIMKIILESIF